jgi:hypothetical protein
MLYLNFPVSYYTCKSKKVEDEVMDEDDEAYQLFGDIRDSLRFL